MIDENIADLKDRDNHSADLREKIFTYLRHWKWFAFSIVICLILGYIYTKLTTPLYKIETQLLIKDNKDNPGAQNDLLKDLDLFTSDKIIDNEIQIIRSKTIIANVIRALKLETSYYNTAGVRKRELYNNLPFEATLLKPSGPTAFEDKLLIRLVNQNEAEVNGKRVNIRYPFQTEDGLIQIVPNVNFPVSSENALISVKFNDMADMLQHYDDYLKVDAVSKQASVLVITLEDAIPQRGIDFLNKLVEEYNQAALEDKNKVASKTLAFIDDRLNTIKDQLGSSEQNVEQYKVSKGIANIGTQSQILLQNVGDNDAQLSKVGIQLEVLHNLEIYVSNDNSQPSNLPSMLGIDDPTLLGLVQQLGDVQQKRLALLQTVPETNPLVSSYSDQINALKNAITSSVQNLKKGLLITRAQLQEKNGNFETIIKQVPIQERGLLDVMRQQHLRDTLYMYLLQKREETAMNLASGVADSRIIDRSSCSKDPVKPVKPLIYAMFLLLGIAFPSSVIYLRDILNFRVTKRADIENATTAPILAEISHSDATTALLVVEKPRSMVSEQIRSLRTNLQFVLPKSDEKVILFTSSISGEGKSFISLNLGASLAMAGKKVVILELDLRKPKLHVGLNMDNSKGLSTYLIGKTDYKEILMQIPLQPNYYIIPSGPIPPNPAELLGNGYISKLIKLLKEEFDYIILDAPPIGLVTDAQILGAYANATMFIVRHNYTAKSIIRVIDNLYQNKKFNNLNIILNSIDI
ncbi:MAG: polysaccharide biosynthesis tyrosine autokinase, partial [Bacteroidetes bacterium]|nr:polysaccharide biosynthesis tyrosine autokinase [Bacteroidota bacterium]